MSKFKPLALALILMLVFSGGAFAADKVKISGSVTSDLVGDPDNGKLKDTEKINLILEKKFGLDADVYLDLGFKSRTKNQIVAPDKEGRLTVKKSPIHQRETEVNIEEAYVNYYTKNIDWRLGKQELNWGSAYKLQPTDYFHPQDLTALKPLDEKVGVKAIKGRYYAPARVEITGVVTPFFATNKVSDTQKQEMLANTMQKVGESLSEKLGMKIIPADYNIKPIADDVENVQGGVKVTKRGLKGFDLSLSAYHGRDKSPILDREATKKTVNPLQGDTKATVKLVYPETNRVGVDVIGDIGDMGIWTEVAYSKYDDDQFEERVETAVGVDYKLENDLYLVGQGYYKEGRTDGESDIKAVNFHFDKPVFEFHTIETNAIYEFESETYVIKPEFVYSLANSTELQLGGMYKESDSEEASSIAALGEERVYARLKVDF